MTPQMFFIFLLPLALLGMTAHFRGPRKSVYFYLIFTAFAVAALALCRHVEAFAPIEPLIIILASGGLVMAAGTLFGEEKPPQRTRSAAEPDVTGGTAYVVTQFPQKKHSPVQREIEGLAARGFNPTVFSLRPVRAETLAPATRGYLERTVSSRAIFSAPLLAANFCWALAHPALYFGALAGLVRSCAGYPAYLFRALANFPRAAFFAEIVRREGIEHLHAHSADFPADCAMVVARLTGAGWSLAARDSDIFAPNPSLPQKLRSAKFVVASTAYNVRYLSGLVPRRERAAIHLNYEGLDPSRYDFEPRVEPAGEPGEFRILAVGRLVETKGYPFLLDAIRQLKERGYAPRLKIIGEGPLRRDLQKLAAAYEIEDDVRLAGEATHARVKREMRRADCLVAPCIVARNGDRDSAPGVISEAMALGLPVVASSVSGIPEFVVDGETGFLVRPGDGAEIADAVERLLSPVFDRLTMVERARAHVEKNFSVAKPRLLC